MKKICNKCGLTLSTNEFHNSKDNKLGVKAVCKNCSNKQKRLYYKNNLHKVRKQNRIKQKRQYKNNPEKYKLSVKNFRHTENGKQTRKRESIKYKSLYPNKIKAVQKLNDLFKYNHIDKDFICGICGKQPIHKHHENYDLPFVFIPLCVKHHNIIHNIKGV